MIQFYLSLVNSEYDKDKLEYIYSKYYSLMFSVAMKYINDIETAEDVVHDSMLKIIKYLINIDINNQLATKSLLCVIVKHRAIDIKRRNTAFPNDDIDELHQILQDETPLPLDLIIQKEGYEKIVQCIRLLSDTYKDVCQLKYINQYKESDIAEILNISLKAVNSRIYRGKQELKKMIAEDANVKQ